MRPGQRSPGKFTSLADALIQDRFNEAGAKKPRKGQTTFDKAQEGVQLQ